MLSKKKKQYLHETYGDWAVITGASSGIGREIAILLADAGINLLLVARSKSNLEKLVCLR